MGEVRTYAELVATGVDLAAGDTNYWVVSPFDYGQWVSFAAWPLSGPPWDKNLEAINLSYDVDAGGNHVVYIDVHNKSASDYASYGLFLLWADAP